MTMPRKLTPEMLDGLSENDSLAIHSRGDLRRIHRLMGTLTIIVKVLRKLPIKKPLKVLELGAGDGVLLLRIACKLEPYWSHVELTLLDQQDLVSSQTIKAYSQFGWIVAVQKTDVLEWANNATEQYDLIIANLFLHHFSSDQLLILFQRIKLQTNCFFACEPRRHWLALAGSHLVGLIGANQVTKMDAVISVHAGFRDQELSTLWSTEKHSISQRFGESWNINEYAAGLFSHCFFSAKKIVGC